MWRATLAWQRRMREVLAPHGLTQVQFVLLATAWWISEHERPPTQAALADRAGTDPMMTSQVVRRLESQGLVRREADSADARARRIVPTGQGRRLLRRALADVEAADAAFFGCLGADVESLTTALGRLACGRADRAPAARSDPAAGDPPA